MESLSDRLRIARERAGLSPTQASDLTGINYKTLNNYEHGVSKPDVGKLSVICRTYNVSADYFVQSEIDEIKNPPTPAEAEAEELTKGERILIDNYRCLNNEGKIAAQGSIESMTFNPKYKKYGDCQEMA